jgi:hypothetical protein
VSTDYAIHSDFLVHWTGKDLDAQDDPNWDTSGKSAIGRECSLCRAYVDRLHSILKYGLWLTEEQEIQLPVNGRQITIPSTPKVCFTELKLSESRTHAKRYGRLGIGVKRPYLFSRFGRPLAYFGFHETNQNDPFLKACANDFKDKNLLNYFQNWGQIIVFANIRDNCDLTRILRFLYFLTFTGSISRSFTRSQ